MTIYDDLPPEAYGDRPDVDALRAGAARRTACGSRTRCCRHTGCEHSTRPPAAA